MNDKVLEKFKDIIGKIRNKDFNIQFTSKELEIMRGIERLFDLNNILNPNTSIYN